MGQRDGRTRRHRDQWQMKIRYEAGNRIAEAQWRLLRVVQETVQYRVHTGTRLKSNPRNKPGSGAEANRVFKVQSRRSGIREIRKSKFKPGSKGSKKATIQK